MPPRRRWIENRRTRRKLRLAPRQVKLSAGGGGARPGLASRLTGAEGAVSNSGIIVVESPRGYLRGMFGYYVGPHLS
ncbi:MAG: hypothetical protein QGI52_05245, partial [Alphaproteobacteria bacterium]|nr:hypothetical protein [Alphaproteobacteria bacterium]